MTLKDTPNIVTKSGIEGLDFTDEVATANALVPEIKRKGVKAIVVLIHQGGSPARESWTGPDGKVYSANPAYNWACDKGGQLDMPSARSWGSPSNLDPQIDMVISGHTHQPYICNIPDPKGQPRLVTSAIVVRSAVHRDRPRRTTSSKNDIVRSSVEGSNMIVTRDLRARTPRRPSSSASTRPWSPRSPTGSLGTITQDIGRSGASVNAGGESGARRPHRRRPAGRPVGRDRWADAGRSRS